MPFACIFVPDFPVEAIVRAEPELRHRAVAVLGGKPPLEKVVAVNEEARLAGVIAGMTKLQAELCDSVMLRHRSELQESAAHQALLDCAQSFSPGVEDVATDTLLIDVSGVEKLFGPLRKIARAISRRASHMGLEANVAVASSLDSALLAARGFSGVTVVPDGKEPECLGGLPVSVLLEEEKNRDKAEEVLQTLQSWGIHKFCELAALPEAELSERLGQFGLELQRKARGTSHRTLSPSDPPLVFEEAIELEYPLVLLEPLAYALNRMLEQLCARLEARALAAQELYLKLMLENGWQGESELSINKDAHEGALPSHSLRRGRVFERAIHLPVPLLNPKTFLTLLQLDLSANPPGAPVKKIALRIEPAKPRPGQKGLFMPASPEPEKLELTLARISGVVGEERVGSPALLDTHRRDAFEMRHFSSSARKNGDDSAENDLVTALRIFRPAVAVHVNQQNGRPTHVAAQKRKELSGDVLWAAGPWRSSGDWWEQDAWIRDEWDIGLCRESGIALYRLVHDVIAGKWLVEGEYD